MGTYKKLCIIAYGLVHVANAIYEIDTVTIKSQR